MSLSLDINLSGDDLVSLAADTVLRRGGEVQHQEIQPFGRRYRDAMIDATPRGQGEAEGRRRLRESYEVEEDYSESTAFYGFRNEEFYLKWVLGGRGEVVAKPGRMLRFAIDGKVLFRKRVGPAKANPFDKGVIDSFRGEGERIAGRIAGRIVDVFEG